MARLGRIAVGACIVVLLAGVFYWAGARHAQRDGSSVSVAEAANHGGPVQSHAPLRSDNMNVAAAETPSGSREIVELPVAQIAPRKQPRPPDPSAIAPFGSRETCLASTALNPQAKIPNDYSMRQLDTLLSELNQEMRVLAEELRTQELAIIQIKIDLGDWTRVEIGESTGASSGAISTTVRLGKDGIPRKIDIFPGQYAPLDDVAARRSACADAGRARIASLIASF